MWFYNFNIVLKINYGRQQMLFFNFGSFIISPSTLMSQFFFIWYHCHTKSLSSSPMTVFMNDPSSKVAFFFTGLNFASDARRLSHRWHSGQREGSILFTKVIQRMRPQRRRPARNMFLLPDTWTEQSGITERCFKHLNYVKKISLEERIAMFYGIFPLTGRRF